jgi:hypothetical protein
MCGRAAVSPRTRAISACISGSVAVAKPMTSSWRESVGSTRIASTMSGTRAMVRPVVRRARKTRRSGLVIS